MTVTRSGRISWPLFGRRAVSRDAVGMALWPTPRIESIFAAPPRRPREARGRPRIGRSRRWLDGSCAAPARPSRRARGPAVVRARFEQLRAEEMVELEHRAYRASTIALYSSYRSAQASPRPLTNE